MSTSTTKHTQTKAERTAKQVELHRKKRQSDPAYALRERLLSAVSLLIRNGYTVIDPEGVKHEQH